MNFLSEIREEVCQRISRKTLQIENGKWWVKVSTLPFCAIVDIQCLYIIYTSVHNLRIMGSQVTMVWRSKRTLQKTDPTHPFLENTNRWSPFRNHQLEGTGKSSFWWAIDGSRFYYSWWFQPKPLWKISCSSKWVVHLPQFSGWKYQKILENCHHPVF